MSQNAAELATFIVRDVDVASIISHSDGDSVSRGACSDVVSQPSTHRHTLTDVDC